MLQIHLPQLKKYENIAAITGVIGFLIGSAIPITGCLAFGWNCPFGNGLIRTFIFSVLIGIVCALVIGNLVAFLLIRRIKHQQNTRKTLQREGDLDGN